MTHRDLTFTLALCISLAAHGLLAVALVESYTRDLQRRIAQPPADAADLLLIVAQPQLGEAAAEGTAIRTSPGDLPLEARDAPAEQPYLSRDPVGDEITATDHAAASALAADSPVAPAGPPEEPSQTAGPLGVPSGLRAAAPARPSRAPPLADDAQAAMPADEAAPPPTAAGDPAPLSDAEIDPFTETGTIEFRGGQIDARIGRGVRTTRPRLTLAAHLDLLALRSPVLILKVATDETGRVRSVDVLKSTGSNTVDQPVQVAVYDWWIEPPVDDDGNPQPDVMVWRITWR